MTSSDFYNKDCQFCLKSATRSPLEEMARHGVDVYFCHTCKAEYLYWGDKELASWSLYTIHHDKMYRWTVAMEGFMSEGAQLWYVKEPGIPGVKPNSKLELIKTFMEDAPDITPENFPIKLPTYLVFI
jgi:hypothetical protein